MQIAGVNEDFCNSVNPIKYVCKRINKDVDAATYTLMQNGSQQKKENYEDAQNDRKIHQ